MTRPVVRGWPFNRNHEAARRHVNQILRDHGRPDYSRRETHIAELLDELIRERDQHRARERDEHRARRRASS
jgi:hypothetical protein